MSTNKKMKKEKPKKHFKSNLSSFVERPIPNSMEVNSFEKVVHKKIRDTRIEDNLYEIYRDKKGEMIDVKKMKIKKRSNWIVRFFKKMFVIIVVALIAYSGYIYFFSKGNDSSALELHITSPEKMIVGEEFTYSIDYINPSKFNLHDIHLEVQYPDNFIFISSSVSPSLGNYAWNLPDIKAHGRSSITITGKLVSPPDSINLITASLDYTPSNFSSNFKKEASSSTIVSDLGFKVSLESDQTAFVGQDNNLNIVLSNIENNYLGNFIINIIPSEGISISIKDKGDLSEDKIKSKEESLVKKETESGVKLTKHRGLNWEIDGLNKEIKEYKIPIIFNVKDNKEEAKITIKLEKKLDDGQSYVFWSKDIQPELINSDLHLSLTADGGINNKAVNFGDTINYKLHYNNQGDNTFKDVIIMVSLDSAFLDWSSLHNKQKGSVHSGSIIWTKNDLPALEKIEPGDEGDMEFSIKLKDWDDSYIGKDLNINSYAQYSFNGQDVKKEKNKSNTVITKINSDLDLIEQIRYFDDDNIPVGSGPLPLRVGKKTSFKVYWIVKNNLHELNDLKVILDLPSYVAWNGKSSTNVGRLSYNNNTHQVTWSVGRLPTPIYKIEANFSISVIPSEADINKILVLSPGSVITAIDTETNDEIYKKTKSTTSKLKDDDIASLNNNGIVQ